MIKTFPISTNLRHIIRPRCKTKVNLNFLAKCVTIYIANTKRNALKFRANYRLNTLHTVFQASRSMQNAYKGNASLDL